MGALIPHIGGAGDGTVTQFAFDCEIPLLGIGEMIGVRRTILWRILAVVRSPADVWGPAISGKTTVHIERRLETTQGIVEVDLGIKAIKRHSAAPAWVKRLGIEDAVASAEYSLVGDLVGETQSRS